jgi:serine phosphatase RsbU (regulator of sigma subunit)
MKPTATEADGVASPPKEGRSMAGSSDPTVCYASQNEEEPEIHAGSIQDARDLVSHLRQREEQSIKLMRITERINYGVTLEEILDFLYEEMRETIPYNRIGLALVDQEQGTIVSRWARSDRPIFLKSGYRGQLGGSTLERIINTGQPRIINDLQGYFDKNPQSRPTRLILREGIRSSLTCPLIIQGKPVGVVFFSSVDKGTYSKDHVAFFQQIAGQLAVIVEKGRLYAELAEQKATIEKQNIAMTRELELAQRVQRSLIPQQAPEVRGLEIAFEYEPAIQVGGDTLDIIPLGDGRALFFVADAMGHGVQAALVMSVVKAALHSAAKADPHPPSVLASVNEVVARLFREHFVTAACCLVDSDGLRAEVSLAGHMGPLWFRSETGSVVQDIYGGLPLGIAEDSEYERYSITLHGKDALLFYTDGIVEAFDSGGNQYGEERLKRQLCDHGGSSPKSVCSSVRRDLKDHCKERPQEDDLTLLVVKFG